MDSSRYKLTKKGRVLCLLLALLLIVALYFVVSGLSSSEDQDLPSGENPGETSQGSIDENPSTDKTSKPALSPAQQQDPDSDVSDGALVIKKVSVFFDPESSDLTDGSKSILNQLIEETTGLSDYYIILEANCATTINGPITNDARASHLALASARGKAVADYLAQNNIDVRDVKNLGADNPSNDNSTFNKRTQNRRVDIYLYR